MKNTKNILPASRSFHRLRIRLVELADQALYRAKENGWNRVEV